MYWLHCGVQFDLSNQMKIRHVYVFFFLAFTVVPCFFHKVYVTQWQPFPLPSNGMENPDTWQEMVQVIFW